MHIVHMSPQDMSGTFVCHLLVLFLPFHLGVIVWLSSRPVCVVGGLVCFAKMHIGLVSYFLGVYSQNYVNNHF